MPTNLIEVDEFTSDVAVPVGTDARTAASVKTPLQALANRTKNLARRMLGLEGQLGTKPGIMVVDNLGVVSPSASYQFDGSLTVSGGVTYLNGGAYAPVKTEAGPDSDTTFLPKDAGLITVETMTADRVYKLLGGPEHVGAIVQIVLLNDFGPRLLYIRDEADVEIAQLHKNDNVFASTDVGVFALLPSGWRRIG